MLKQPMIEKMLALRLLGMVEAFKTQEQDAVSHGLSFLERLGLLVDQQWNWRENQALGRRLKNAKLRINACVEEIDYRTTRGLDKSVIRALVQESAWVGKHENIFVLAPRASANASSRRPWRRRLAAMDTHHFIRGLSRCFEIWLWPAPTAVYAICLFGSVTSMFQ